MVEGFDRGAGNRVDDAVGYREVRLFDYDAKLAGALVEAIGAYGRAHWRDGDMEGAMGAIQEEIRSGQESGWRSAGATLMGLNKNYRQGWWEEKLNAGSERHLRAFIDGFVGGSGFARSDVIALMGFVSAAFEADKLGSGDLTAQRLGKLYEEDSGVFSLLGL